MSQQPTERGKLRIIIDNDLESLVGSLDERSYEEISSHPPVRGERAYSDVSSSEADELQVQIHRERLENELIDAALSMDNNVLFEAYRCSLEREFLTVSPHPEDFEQTVIVIYRNRR